MPAAPLEPHQLRQVAESFSTGTGIAARQLQAAGARVLGVDPDARMAEVARSFGLPVEVATFEDWDAAGRAFDAVVAAQAWHWVDPAAGAAKAAQMLRPGGRLTLFWNAGQRSPEAAAAFATVAARLPADRLAELLADTGAALDALGGGFTMHYGAVAVTSAR